MDQVYRRSLTLAFILLDFYIWITGGVISSIVAFVFGIIILFSRILSN